jgi:hypothetical protein
MWDIKKRILKSLKVLVFAGFSSPLLKNAEILDA